MVLQRDAEERLASALAERYRIESEIDSGGMATVYRARDLKHDRPVAIKVLRPNLAQAIGADRFLREIRTTANLSHPHILPLHDSGEADGFLFYVMPFVEGESLRDRLEREGRLPVEDAIRIAREVADALAYAHDKGVIHRDIKPANIMLERDHALLADFGIAQAKAGAEETRLTGTGMSLGTPSYMSPEQITGDQELDGRVDQYALACVLYEMLAGEPPFPGDSVPAVLRQHLAVAPPQLREVLPALPQEVAAGVARALAKDPDERFASIKEFMGALEGKGGGGSRGPWSGDPRSRRRRVMSGLLGLLTTAAVTLWIIRPFLAPAGGPALGRLAVLPCADFTGDSAQEYVVAGIHDGIFDALGRVAGVAVIGRASVFQLGATDATPLEMSRQLGVRGLVGCSLYRQGSDSVRVTAYLLDAVNDEQIWSDAFVRTMTDVFLLGGDVALGVAEALDAGLSSADSLQVAARPSESREAERLFRVGQELKGRMVEGPLLASLDYFDQAIALDSSFAIAYAAKAEVTMLMGDATGVSADIRPIEYMHEVRALVERALEIDPDLAYGHMMLGWISWYYDYDYSKAEPEAKLATEMDPTNAWAWGNYGDLLTAMGRDEEAYEAFSRALEVDPVDPAVLQEFSWNLVLARRYQEAIEKANLASQLDPGLPAVYQNIGDASMMLGMREEAFRAYELARANAPEHPAYMAVLGAGYARTGRREEALAVLDSMKAMAHQRYVNPRAFAEIYLGLDSLDAAMDQLIRAAEIRDPGVNMHRRHPFQDVLLNHPRYPEFLRLVRLER